MKRKESRQVHFHPVTRLQLRIRLLLMFAGVFAILLGLYHAYVVIYGE